MTQLSKDIIIELSSTVQCESAVLLFAVLCSSRLLRRYKHKQYILYERLEAAPGRLQSIPPPPNSVVLIHVHHWLYVTNLTGLRHKHKNKHQQQKNEVNRFDTTK